MPPNSIEELCKTACAHVQADTQLEHQVRNLLNIIHGCVVSCAGYYTEGQTKYKLCRSIGLRNVQELKKIVPCTSFDELVQVQKQQMQNGEF